MKIILAFLLLSGILPGILAVKALTSLEINYYSRGRGSDRDMVVSPKIEFAIFNRKTEIYYRPVALLFLVLGVTLYTAGFAILLFYPKQ